MLPEDIGRLVTVGDPRVSPDGGHVAFAVTHVDLPGNRYRSAVWVAAADGSQPPRPLTAGDRRAGSPRWSPDGSRVAVTTVGEDGTCALEVVPFSVPGETFRVCERPEAFTDVAWSPDGTRLAFVSRERARRWTDGDDERSRPPRRIDRLFPRLDDVGWTIDRPAGLFVVPADGTAAPVLLLAGPPDHAGAAWSPDGGTLATCAARGDDLTPVTDVHLVDARAVRGPVGPRTLAAPRTSRTAPAFSPDGRLAVLTEDSFVWPSFSRLSVVDPATGESRSPATGPDLNCTPLRELLWDGDAVVVALEDRGDVHLYRVPAAGDAGAALLVGGRRAVTGYDLAGGTLAFTATDPGALPEVHVLRDGVERRLTSFGAGFHAAVPTGVPEQFTVPSPKGDGDLDVWLLRPARPATSEASGRTPVLLSIHGGPAAQYTNAFFDEFHFLAGAGYAVVWTNPHGSTGRTEAWAQEVRPPEADEVPGSGWGGVDADDVLAALDGALARDPGLDPERLGVLGGSYGGFLTSWLVGHTDRFAAACSERAVNNLESEEWSADVAGSFRYEMGVTHLDAPEVYRRMSPVTYVRDITTPMLLLHSENDLRCHVEQADALYLALRMLGKDVEYWRFPEESHELSRSGSPVHRVQRAQIILDFFGRRLGGRRPRITWDHPARTAGPADRPTDDA
ncbi:S9 family peptidase [Kineosporia sp. R_H_3]|uniref:S9 family peptidase n=1 Tax=Kineosporia sp. R_H_3 TaxID=1961848 RepID=UPI000B4B1F4F|nr:S9 family peptidase [Kineosporia sp. R_H_3]